MLQEKPYLEEDWVSELDFSGCFWICSSGICRENACEAGRKMG